MPYFEHAELLHYLDLDRSAHAAGNRHQMAGTGKAITYRELDELSNQGAHLFCSSVKAGYDVAFLIQHLLRLHGDSARRRTAWSS